MDYIKELEISLKGKTFYEQMMLVKKVVVFDSPNNKGVYQIEDFYIGKSGNILGRITYHILEVLNIEKSKVIFNKEKLYLIYSILKNRKLKITHLDRNTKKEKEYIEILYPILPLVNIEFVTEKMRLKKQELFLKTIKNKKPTITFEKFSSKFVVAKTFVSGATIFKISWTQLKAHELLNNYFQKKFYKKSRAERRALVKKKTK